MKHPTLMKFLSVILIILLLFSSTFAAFQVNNLKENIAVELVSVDSLSQTLIDYKAAVAELNECGIDYDEVSAELESLKSAHSESASDHKTELSQYTAEKSGYLQGADALWEAKAAMPEAWAEFTAAKDAFYEKYNAFYEGKAELEQYSWIFENYDSVYSVLNALLNQADTLSGQMQAVEQWLDSEENIDATADALNAQIDTVRNNLNGILDLINQLPEEQRNVVNQTVADMTGMTLDELSAALYNSDSVTAEDIRNFYSGIEGQLSSGADGVRTQAQEYLIQFAQLYETWQTMLASEPMLISGKEAIDAAEQQLIDGEGTIQSSLEEIWYQLGQLDIEKSELEDEKNSLEKEAERLSELSDQAAQYENLRNRVDNLETKLMANEAVRSAVDHGMSIEEACEQVIDDVTVQLAEKDKLINQFIILLVASFVGGLIAAVACLTRKPCVALLPVSLVICVLFQSLAVWRNYGITESVFVPGAIVSVYSVIMFFLSSVPFKEKK